MALGPVVRAWPQEVDEYIDCAPRVCRSEELGGPHCSATCVVVSRAVERRLSAFQARKIVPRIRLSGTDEPSLNVAVAAMTRSPTTPASSKSLRAPVRPAHQSSGRRAEARPAGARSSLYASGRRAEARPRTFLRPKGPGQARQWPRYHTASRAQERLVPAEAERVAHRVEVHPERLASDLARLHVVLPRP